ncbi:hypothetical protein AB3N62_15460 [Leptospira sp. WS4.C2]
MIKVVTIIAMISVGIRELKSHLSQYKEIVDCRSLDGIHVATAIFLKDVMRSSNFAFHGFDNRVNEVAGKFGLKPKVA